MSTLTYIYHRFSVRNLLRTPLIVHQYKKTCYMETMLSMLLFGIIIHPTLASDNQCLHYYCTNNLLEKLGLLDTECTKLEKKYTALDKQNDELLTITKTLNKSVEGLTQSNERQQEINMQLQEENEQLKTLNRTLEGLAESNKAQQEVITQLQEENEQLKRSLENQTMDMKDIRDKVSLLGNTTFPVDRTERIISSLIDAAKAISTYVRWGRSDCPANNTELVYAGAVGGSNYNHYGGASNFLCLSMDPSWMKYKDGIQRHTNAFIYGTEYRFHERIGEFFQTSLFGQEVPCAVCKSSNPANLMIPGQTNCPSGWRVEYKGHLVTTYPDFQVSGEYICLDENPEPLERSSSSLKDGVFLYVVEAQCGSLHCLPYVSGRELTCVVCSR